MVPYYENQTSQWAAVSTSMQAAVILDQPGNVAFTNLDTISGKVVVRSLKSADVDNIVVKLEGESRTRLMTPVGPAGERPKPQIEYHKVLYKLQVVFPPADVRESRSQMGGKAAYTLPQGQHEYPFSFKIPFNNSCSFNNKTQPMSMSLEPAMPARFHVKKTLPPTLSGFPGEAEIRYFVKVTVNRHSIFKENPRAYTPFNFFPIEPPRKAPSGSEVYARQKHKFDAFPASGGAAKDKMKSMFSSKKSSLPNSPITSTGPGQAFLSIDARLPEPAILTCNSDIPLRLIIKKLSDFREALHLQSLQIALIGHTKIRAHDVFRTETNSWIITSKSNMNILVGSATDPADTEIVLQDGLWRGMVLPNTVAPSFQTCNIERGYQLDVRVGLSYGTGVKPQNIVLPLRLDVQVYSGIAPPPQVLERMAAVQRKPSKAPVTPSAVSEKLRIERQDSDFGSNQVPPTPLTEAGPAFPPRPVEGLPEYGDAPPSYEDAIASDVPAVAQAQRPEYVPPPHQEDLLLGSDEKKGWRG